MTTIAYRGGVVAADSRQVDGNRIETCTKLFRVKSGKNKGHVVGLAGDTYAGMVFLDWYSGALDKPPVFDPCDDFAALVLSAAGIFTADRFCRLIPVEDKFTALGSGSDFAIAAMACGKSAREAVELAAQYDINTGGRVVTMRLEKRR